MYVFVKNKNKESPRRGLEPRTYRLTAERATSCASRAIFILFGFFFTNINTIFLLFQLREIIFCQGFSMISAIDYLYDPYDYSQPLEYFL